MLNNLSNGVNTKNASNTTLALARDLEKIQTEMSLMEELPMKLFGSIDVNNTFSTMLPYNVHPIEKGPSYLPLI